MSPKKKITKPPRLNPLTGEDVKPVTKEDLIKRVRKRIENDRQLDNNKDASPIRNLDVKIILESFFDTVIDQLRNRNVIICLNEREVNPATSFGFFYKGPAKRRTKGGKGFLLSKKHPRFAFTTQFKKHLLAEIEKKHGILITAEAFDHYKENVYEEFEYLWSNDNSVSDITYRR